MFHLKSLEERNMTLKEAGEHGCSAIREKKITCQYFHDEWIMFDGSRLFFEMEWNRIVVVGEMPCEFKCRWYEIKEGETE